MDNLSRYSIRQILLTVIILLTSIVMVSTVYATYRALQKLEEVRELKQAVATADHLGDAVEKMAVERGAVLAMLGMEQGQRDIIQPRLKESREAVDASLARAFEGLKEYEFDNLPPLIARSRELYAQLNDLRALAEAQSNKPLDQRMEDLPKRWFDHATSTIMAMQQLRMGLNQHYVHIDPIITQQMLFKHFLWQVTEYAGRERALIGYLIVSNKPLTPEDQERLLLWRGIAENSWQTTRSLAQRSGLDLSDYLNEAESHYFTVFDSMRDIFYTIETEPEEHTDYPFSNEFWHELASQAIESLLELKDASLLEARKVTDRAEYLAQMNILSQLTILLLTLLIGVFAIWVIVFRVIRPINHIVEALFDEAVRSQHSLAVSSDRTISQVSRQQNEIKKLTHVLKLYRMAGNAIRENETQLRNIFENTIDGLITMDVDGVITKINPACEHIFGYEPEEIVGRNVELIMPQAYLDYVQSTEDNGMVKLMNKVREMEGIHKNGKTFPLEISTSEIYLHGQQYFSSIVRDVTEQKAAERERERFLRKLKESNEELERFAYIASHDLKAPLRAIDNLSKWIEEDLGEAIEGESREYMDLLHLRVHRMEKLLDDLLQYSRIGHKMDKTYEELIGGDELMADILSLVNAPKSFEINFSQAFSTIKVYRMPLQQILYNLISNAIKHHDKEKGHVKVDVKEKGNFYEFCVEDDGPGIPKAYHEKIFEMFQTLKPRDEVEGSGIGLAIVKKTIKLQGGELFLESEEGKGSHFRFTWPKEPVW